MIFISYKRNNELDLKAGNDKDARVVGTFIIKHSIYSEFISL